MVILPYIPDKKLVKTRFHQVTQAVFLDIICNKSGELCQEPVWERIFVNMLLNLIGGVRIRFKKDIGYCWRQLFFQYIRNQPPPDISSAAFIPQDISQGGHMLDYCFTIKITGIGSCTHDTCYAGFTLT